LTSKPPKYTLKGRVGTVGFLSKTEFFGEQGVLAGWLLLPGLGVIFGPIVGAIGISQVISDLRFSQDISYKLWIYMVVDIVIVCFGLYVAWKYLQRRFEAPMLVLTLMFLKLAACYSAVLVFPGDESILAEAVRNTFLAIILAYYFNTSIRVKRTFSY
jgi:hypothetical protein